jgi:gamma-glutamylcyclotransferase (GGCT)/AIG2-like uncharacterized protein YtfP
VVDVTDCVVAAAADDDDVVVELLVVVLLEELLSSLDELEELLLLELLLGLVVELVGDSVANTVTLSSERTTASDNIARNFFFIITSSFLK